MTGVLLPLDRSVMASKPCRSLCWFSDQASGQSPDSRSRSPPVKGEDPAATDLDALKTGATQQLPNLSYTEANHFRRLLRAQIPSCGLRSSSLGSCFMSTSGAPGEGHSKSETSVTTEEQPIVPAALCHDSAFLSTSPWMMRLLRSFTSAVPMVSEVPPETAAVPSPERSRY